ncbi:MAG: M28 family peptidase [Candidatus Coatesbacteria bacterium]|nr:M28 family peptidase [Candidatus Coatesbacteria bacterium]
MTLDRKYLCSSLLICAGACIALILFAAIAEATSQEGHHALDRCLLADGFFGSDLIPNTVSEEFLREIRAHISQENLIEHIEALTSIETRYTFRPEFLESASYVFDTLETYGVETRYDDHIFGVHTLRNVAGRITGEVFPERVIVIGAHLDNILHPSERNSAEGAFGADDNATGVAVVLEAARIFSLYPPPVTIEFLAYSGEEQLMLGSEYYAGAGLGERVQFVAAFGIDSLGWNPDGKMEQKADANRNSEWLLPYVKSAETLTSVSTVLVTEDSQDYQLWRSQDHQPFWYHGIPALAIGGTAYGTNWHTLNDTLENLDIPLFVEGAKLSILTIAGLVFDANQQPQISIYSTLEDYELDSRVDIDLSCANPSGELDCILYLAVVGPSGEMSFYPSWSSDVSGIQVNIPANTYIERTRILEIDLPSLSPPIMSPGVYRFETCLTSLDGAILGEIAYASFNAKAESICPDGMVRIPSGSFTDILGNRHFVMEYCIDRYEYPNLIGALPTHSLSWIEAWRHCTEMGKYLCSADEWIRACKGPDDFIYPYGNIYQVGPCNTEGTDVSVIGPSSQCISGFGVYDMSGNVFEWTSGAQWRNLLFGGYFKSKDLGASCESGIYPYPSSVSGAMPYGGFRCCKH